MYKSFFALALVSGLANAVTAVHVSVAHVSPHVAVAEAHVAPHVAVSEPAAHVSVAHAEVESVPIRSMSVSERSLVIPKAVRLYGPRYTPLRYYHNTDEQADPLLTTVCTPDEFSKAQQWQALCKQTDLKYCELLSYFRYCEQADIDAVSVLRKAKPEYHNIYVDDSAKPDQ